MNVVARVRRLTLTNFRNYRTASLVTTADLVVLTGPNGAGKTNVLEAISFLAPGRGLRRAQLDEVAFTDGSAERAGVWAVAVQVDGALGLATLGTGAGPAFPGDMAAGRRFRIDREPVGSAAEFAEHLRVVWLVPAMDRLFSGPPSERRRFLDRLVLAIDPAHAARVAALDRVLRSRNRLLENPDPHWLDATEREAAEIAVAVAAARVETMRRLSAAVAGPDAERAGFPTAEVALEGSIETRMLTQPAIEVEDCYRAILRENRGRDATAGRTLDGPHLTDLEVWYREKEIAARDASTGEQKALLIGLVLAHAALVRDMTGATPVILLDEVAAHLDAGRRASLFAALERLGAQVWMTGADGATFADVARRADILDVRALQVP